VSALLLVLALLVGSASAEEAATPAPQGLAEPPALAPPPPEEVGPRAAEIARIVRCPVCQGLSVEDSHADAAVAMKQRITELVALGYDEAQITGYFVDRYGEWVRLKPPATGINWIIWLSPVALAAVGAGVILSRRRSEPAAAPSTPAAAAPAVDDAYRRRILEELDEGKERR